MSNINNEVVKALLCKESEVMYKFHNTIEEVLRLGYETERGKETVNRLFESVDYSMEQLNRQINVINKQ